MTRQNEIRKEILMQLYAVAPVPLTAERIERDCKKHLYDYTAREIGRELQFLADEKLAVEVKDASDTARHYRITSDGVRDYEQKFSS